MLGHVKVTENRSKSPHHEETAFGETYTVGPGMDLHASRLALYASPPVAPEPPLGVCLVVEELVERPDTVDLTAGFEVGEAPLAYAEPTLGWYPNEPGSDQGELEVVPSTHAPGPWVVGHAEGTVHLGNREGTSLLARMEEGQIVVVDVVARTWNRSRQQHRPLPPLSPLPEERPTSPTVWLVLVLVLIILLRCSLCYALQI